MGQANVLASMGSNPCLFAKYRRSDREADGAPLLREYAETHQGFESPLLRQIANVVKMVDTPPSGGGFVRSESSSLSVRTKDYWRVG